MIDKNSFLPWVSPKLKASTLDAIRGYTAISFPAAYFRRAPKSLSPKWVNLTSTNCVGVVVKAAPPAWVDEFIVKLDGYGVTYDTVEL